VPPRDVKPGARRRARPVVDGVPREPALPVVDGVPREHVTEIQRVRILLAMAEVAAERGAVQASVAHIVSRAGVSRRTFYDLFEDREDCFLATFDEVVARASVPVLAAYQAEGRWRERIRAGLLALLVFFDEEPALARFVVVEALAAGPRALERRGEIVGELVCAVDEGRAERPARAPEPPPLAAEGAVGAVFAVIHARLAAGGPEPLTGLLGSLMSAIVMPFQGGAAAQKELHKPAPLLKISPARHYGDPLEGLEMRITYRTVRVLMAIGSGPGASNREIATAAGIQDQGQVSKLLTRLEHLGLVHNEGVGPAKGAPNAWTLTAKGQRIEDAVRVQSAPRSGRGS
jgi:AcrR family transcriptional regulator/DNA-binding MarR family transcriptional regulator